MPPLFLVMLGGAVGAGSRYLVGIGAVRLLGVGFPWGTFAVNLIGGFLMGMLAAALVRFSDVGSNQLRLLLGVGVLGGFTTFSSFSLETLLMADRGQVGLAALYVAGSVFGAIACLQLGRVFGRAIL